VDYSQTQHHVQVIYVCICIRMLVVAAYCTEYCSVMQCVRGVGFEIHEISSVVQCVAAYCSVLQCVAACCSVLQRVVVCCSMLQRVRGAAFTIGEPV